MESEREAYLKRIVKKKKRNSIIWVIILGIIILFAFFLQFFDNSLYSHFIAFVGDAMLLIGVTPIRLPPQLLPPGVAAD